MDECMDDPKIGFREVTAKNWRMLKESIIASECAFPEPIRCDAPHFCNILKKNGAVAYVALAGRSYIGNIFGCAVSAEEMAECGLSETEKAVYIFNFVIDKKFRKNGYGTELLLKFIREARTKGYEKVVGHFCRESSKLMKRLGAKEKGVMNNWCGSGDDYTVCELDISSPVMAPCQ